MRVASLYERMRKRMLFFAIGIVNILESKFPSNACQFFMIGICLSQKEEHKIEKKSDSYIYKDICTSSNTKEVSYEVKCGRHKSKEEESSSHSKKNEKMKSIEPLSPRNIVCYKGDDESRYDEEDLKKCHERGDIRERLDWQELHL